MSSRQRTKKPAQANKYRSFVRHVQNYHFSHGRHELPWRKTFDPYHILVSEIMLQQTQAERVVPKFVAFVKKYPSVNKLARASLRDVYALWSGLGYNRRAKYLRDSAITIADLHKGIMPLSEEALCKLPGVGPYTAAAVLVFTKNLKDSVIETNVRSVIIAHFFPRSKKVSDTRIREVLDKCKLYIRDWYAWNAALMDYGAHLKKTKNHARKSLVYSKQKPFKGSLRQVRGEIMKLLSVHQKIEQQNVVNALHFSSNTVKKAIESLEKDSLIVVMRTQHNDSVIRLSQ